MPLDSLVLTVSHSTLLDSLALTVTDECAGLSGTAAGMVAGDFEKLSVVGSGTLE